MKNIKCIKIININSKTYEIIFKCNDNTKRKFNINSILNSNNISEGMKETWKCMLNSGDFNKAYLLDGDLIWPGRCEIIANDLNEYLEVI